MVAASLMRAHGGPAAASGLPPLGAWLGLSLLVASGSALAQPAVDDIRFQGVGLDRGLEARVVSSLLLDPAGFLWVGSRDGLYRYDGYEAIRFAPEPGNPDSISDNDIRDLFLAGDGSIWISTNTGGLNRLDPETLRFEAFRSQPDNPATLSYDSVYGMAEAENGHLWAGTQFGLNRFDPETGAFTRFLHDPADPESIPHDYVFTVLADSEDTLWVGTVGGGLARDRTGDGRFETVDLAAALDGGPELNEVFALAESQGSIWAGTRAGLVRIDRRTLQASEVLFDGQAIGTIPTLEVGPDGRIWIARLSAGVLVHDPGSGRSAPANDQPLGVEGQLPAVPQLSLEFLDERVFIGTWGNGLHVGSMATNRFRVSRVGSEEGALRHQNVTAVHHDDATGRTWAGTFGGGLQALTNQATGIRAEAPEPAIGADGILSIVRAGDGRLYAGSTTGLWEIAGDDAPTRHRHVPGRAGSIGFGYVVSLLESSSGSIWAGLGGSGLYERRTAGGDFRAHLSVPEDPASLSGNFVTALMESGSGELWVGTRSNGLSVCSVEPWRCRRYDRSSTPGLAHDNVSAIVTDSAGQVWIGTNGAGLQRAVLNEDRQPVDFEQWSEEDGLLGASVMGIVEDDDGSLWISSRDGVTRFDPRAGRMASYGAARGLPITHFNPRAADRDRDWLYFGGIGGLVAFPAGTTFPEFRASPVRLTSIRRAGEGSPADRTLPLSEPLRMPWRAPFTVQFAVLDFAEVPHLYRYRFGPEGEWISQGASREITFFGLAPGRHALEISGRDAFGAWSPPERLDIEIVPPFWMTTWFQITAIVIAALLLLLWHRIRMRSLERKNLALVGLQEQREKALERAEANQKELTQAYRDLRQLTHRLESAKEQERRHLSRELHDELGQSLTASKLNLQMLKRGIGDKAMAGQLSDAVAMCDAMIEQVRSISLNLRPPMLDELGLAAALDQFVENLARTTGTAVEFEHVGEVGGNSPEVRTAVFRVVQEATNNAIRHAGASRIRVRLQRERDGQRVVVEDDGCGFDPATIEESRYSGGHLGLLGMNERIQAVGGTLQIDSRPGDGCRIDAWIPDP